MVSSLALVSIAVKGLKAFQVVVFTRVDFRFTNRSFNVTLWQYSGEDIWV